MVVKARPASPAGLDLAYLALFLGMRANQLVLEQLKAAGFKNARESHGYVMQHLIEKERSITELAERMEVTQQAASKVVAELAELGIFEISPSSDRRAKKVRLTLRGWSLVRLGRQIRRQIEGRLIRAAGEEQYRSAKSILSTCLEALGGMERIRMRRIQPPQ
jgi:DNA-binding MarR family transcriptional regulator